MMVMPFPMPHPESLNRCRKIQFKYNVDGAAKDGETGCDGVLRDENVFTAFGFLAVSKGYCRLRLYQLDRVVEVARLGFCYAGSSLLQQRLFLSAVPCHHVRQRHSTEVLRPSFQPTLKKRKGMILRLMNPILSCSKCLLYFFLVVFFLCNQSINAQNATTDPSEVRALNSIFRQWSTRAADTWNISGEPCSGSALNQRDFMFGDPVNNPAIRCDCSFKDAAVCRITILRVVDLDRQGEIPKELLDLPFLTVLNIEKNFFTGPLPEFIGKMSRLETLSISYNSFSGPIPKELGNLKDLTVLSMSNNNFSGTLPPELGNLAKLEQLYFNSCGFSGEIPSTFAKLERLQIVWASDNAFTGKIPDFVGNNWTKLTSLRIGDIYNGSSSLDFVRNLTNLTDLDLSFNNLTGTIPIALFTMNSLQDLFLGNNSLTGDIPKIKNATLQTM
ncbi:hypothetical protein V6N13_084284 [Hibiscus sabdariffa]|uniref:Uncharacterized protein n=1 Tax=Hibiscus sabdariffa TaxID=183260 RepID=A0ABR2T0K1_9ROSI